MLNKKSLSKTYKLINKAQLTIFLSQDNNLSYKLALSLVAVYYNNVQYINCNQGISIVNKLKKFIKTDNMGNDVSKLFILNINKCFSYEDRDKISKRISELADFLVDKNNIKVILLLNSTEIENLNNYLKAYFDELKIRSLIYVVGEKSNQHFIGTNGKEKIHYTFDEETELCLEIDN